MKRPARILHIITGLGIGGAETMLFQLLRAMDKARFSSAVISLSRQNEMAAPIRALGVPVKEMGLPAGRPSFRSGVGLIHAIRSLAPDLVQTWMYHADLLGGVAGRIGTLAPVVWGLHNTNLDTSATKWTTRATVRACALLSSLVPARILSCSQAAAQVHGRLGYDQARLVVVPNGFDTDLFRPSEEHYWGVRASLGLPCNAVLVGMVARYDLQKDHANFIAAAAQVAARRDDVRFVLAGRDIHHDNAALFALVERTGLAERFYLLGLRSDTSRLNAAFDLAVTSSAFGEAFPMVIGEAMACGVPCVVTDVGDSALIVQDTGLVIPARNPAALAAAIGGVLDLPIDVRRTLGRRARARIKSEFSLASVARRYEALYAELLAGRY